MFVSRPSCTSLSLLLSLAAAVSIKPRDLELRWLITTKQPYQEGVGGISDATVLSLTRTNSQSNSDAWVLRQVTRDEAPTEPYPPFLLYDTKVATAADNVCFDPDCQGLQLAATRIQWTVPPTDGGREGGAGQFGFFLTDATVRQNGTVGASNIKGQGGWTQDDGHLLAIARGTPEDFAMGTYWWDFSSWTLCDGFGTRVITYNGTDPSCERFYVQLLAHDPYQSTCTG